MADGRFDAIYQALLALAERSTRLKPIPLRFNRWQKAGIIAILVVGALLLPLTGYAAARVVANLWWPERVGLLLVLLLHLLAFLLAGMAGLSWWERRKPRWDRAWTHPWMLIGVNLCFFLSGIGAWGLAETAVATWRSDLLLTAGDERMWYVLLGYAGVFTAVLLLAVAGPLMPRLLTLIDERF